MAAIKIEQQPCCAGGCTERGTNIEIVGDLDMLEIMGAISVCDKHRDAEGVQLRRAVEQIYGGRTDKASEPVRGMLRGLLDTITLQTALAMLGDMVYQDRQKEGKAK